MGVLRIPHEVELAGLDYHEQKPITASEQEIREAELQAASNL